MKSPPTSYKDPYYADLAATMEGKFGLPSGLLHNIITKGERSNADQVSSAGAKTVAQITPSTRNLALKKFGVDAYASAENALEVAARILKESLDRNDGSVTEAVAEYHAGTNPRARGPINRAYVARVTGQRAEEPASADRAAGRPVPLAPQRTIDAYNAGTMTSADRAAFDQGLTRGQFRLPEGQALTAPTGPKADPSVSVVPARIIERFNNRSDMTDSQRDLIDRDIAAGNLRLPEGQKLTRPGPRTAGESFGMGVRTDMRALSGLADIPAGGLNAAINIPFVLAGQKAPLSTTPFGDMANSGADLMKLATPATSGEKLIDAAGQGLIQGVATAGLAAPLAGASGATGAVAKGLSSAPVLDTISGGAAGLASEAANQAGAGPLGQLAAGLVGGAAPVGAAGVAERLTPKYGPKLAQVVETTPKAVLMDEAGQFTDEGREVIARAGVEPEQIKAAYDEAATPQAEPGGQTVRVFEGVEHPVEVVGAAERNATDGRDYVPVRTPDGQEGYVPADEVVSKPAAETTPEAAPDSVGTSSTEAPLPASAAARMAEAQSEGVTLTKGQATKDFETQTAENDLSGTNTAEGRAVREHLSQQAEAIKQAVTKFRESLGDTTIGATERGEAVKVGLRDLMDQGKQGVTAAYQRVREMADQLGDNAKGLTRLDTSPIRESVLDILGDDTVSDAVRTGLTQIAAKFGIIGEKPRHIPETGRTTVMVRDAENNLVKGPNFAGQVETLDLTNAERFRQRINDLYDKMASRNPQERLKPVLDDAVAEAAERAAKEGFGDVGRAATEARDAFKAQKATFEAKDVVNDIVAWKNGAPGTEKINPERIWSMVFGTGPDALSNIRKLRAVLLNKPTAASKAAWKAIQAQTAADLFQKALVVNGNGGEGAISGSKLNTAYEKFGGEKLKLILDEDHFNSFQKLRRVIGDATIPLPKTTNPSGSGHLIARFLGNTAKGALTGARMVPGIGQAVDVVAGLAKAGAERTQAERVAEGATRFTPEQAAKADAQAAPKTDATPAPSPDEAIRQFLDLASSNRLLAPLLVSTAASQKEGDQ